MSNKLAGGDAFPAFPLTFTDGSNLSLPGDTKSNYTVVLFYRGSF